MLNNMLRKRKIYIPCDIELFDDFIFYNDIVISAPQIEKTLTILKEQLKPYFDKWLPYYTYTYTSYLPLDVEKMKEEIASLWESYVSNNLHNWERWVYSLYVDYNPIENVDAYETYTTEYVGKEKDTFTPSGEETTTSTPTGKTKSTTVNANSPQDNNTFYNAEKTESTAEFENYQNENKLTFNNRKNENVKEFDNRKDIQTNRRHGNIGVTKSTEMALDEIKARRFDIVEMIVKSFLNKYFSIGVDENWL